MPVVVVVDMRIKAAIRSIQTQLSNLFGERERFIPTTNHVV
jgi:hypothetical protein